MCVFKSDNLYLLWLFTSSPPTFIFFSVRNLIFFCFLLLKYKAKINFGTRLLQNVTSFSSVSFLNKWWINREGSNKNSCNYKERGFTNGKRKIIYEGLIVIWLKMYGKLAINAIINLQMSLIELKFKNHAFNFVKSFADLNPFFNFNFFKLLISAKISIMLLTVTLPSSLFLLLILLFLFYVFFSAHFPLVRPLRILLYEFLLVSSFSLLSGPYLYYL